MLDDFHESPRSVGFVGFLLGLLVLAGFCGLGIAVMSGDAKSGSASISSKILDQERMIEQYTKDLEKAKDKLVTAQNTKEAVKVYAVSTGVMEKEEELIAKHQKEVEGFKAHLEEIQQDFLKHRDQYRINERNLAIGETLDLSETMGADYKNCKVTRITPLHLSVMKSSGPGGVPYDKLPSAIIDRFQFSEEEAAAYQDKINVMKAKIGKRDQEIRRISKEKKGAADRLAMIKELERLEREIIEKTDFAKQQQGYADTWDGNARALDRKAAQARAAGRISAKVGQARQARDKSAVFLKRAVEARAAVAKMKRLRSEYRRDIKYGKYAK